MDDFVRYIVRLVAPPQNASHKIRSPPGYRLSERYDFHTLPQSISKQISFVDGGTVEVLMTPSLAVHFHRVVALKPLSLQEFYTVCSLDKVCTIRAFAIQGKTPESITVDPTDPLIAPKSSVASFDTLANYFRRCVELTVANECSSAVIDGSLHALLPLEKGLVQKLHDVTAVAKTCRWLTETGQSCVQMLSQSASKATWYTIVGNGPGFEVGFVKFSRGSHVVKVESRDVRESIQMLISHTNDSSFLGYPYGLIAADRIARVGKEREYHQTRVRVLLGKHWEELAISALNAHDLLDSICSTAKE